MFERRLRILLIALVAALYLPLMVWGQEHQLTIKGVVTDPTGAVVPNAKVTVRDTDTNEVAEARTNEKGAYKLPFHRSLKMEVSAEASGFKTATHPLGVMFNSGTAKLDFVLEVKGTEDQPAAQEHATQSAKVGYTMEEYNAYMAATNEKDLQQRVASLDAFVARYPSSALMPYVYNVYYSAYKELKDYHKAFEYADKLVALGVPIDSITRLQALYTRCQLFAYIFDRDASDAHEQLVRQRDLALEGVKLAAQTAKPSNSTMTDAQYADAMKTSEAQFYEFAGNADLELRDIGAAEDTLKSSLALDPTDARAHYLLGAAYIKQNPPQFTDGIWYMARSVALKDVGEAQIRDYLHRAIMAHQHSTCGSFVDSEVNDIIRLAANSAEPPAGFTISSEVTEEDEKVCGAQSSGRTEVARVSGNTSQPEASSRGFARDERPEAGPVATHAGRYFALVIGINDYRFVDKLRTAVNDAEAVAGVLRDHYGFETKVLTNATREQIMRALNEYRRTLDENSNLLIYYAGHGVYDKEASKTYWLPVDGERQDPTNWIIADEITTDIKVIPARHILIISDSCYSGGITRSVNMAFTPQEQGRYLEKMIAGKSRTLMSSGGLEPVSDEGGAGHSVFANALIRGLTAEEDTTFSAEAFFEEFIRVSVAGRSDQTPEYNVIRNSGHDSGDFVFVRTK